MTPISFRRHIHRNPELSFQEYETAHFIAEQLSLCGIENRPIAKTGVLAKIEGQGDLSRAVVLRADIDALPINEATGLDFSSEKQGVMHACGHDMHAAILFGVMQRIAAEPTFEGTIFGLFQPAEECNPGGASVVLAENPFEGYDVVAVVGEHTDPSLEVGVFGFREGQYMASSDELRFTIRGKGGHAAMRERLNDPVLAQAELVREILALNSTERIISLGRIEAQGATNVVPDEVYIEGTMRTYSEQVRSKTKSQIETLAAQIATRCSVEIDVDINHGYPSVVNDARLTRQAKSLADELFSSVELNLRPTAEDFGFYCQRYPSLFYRFGVGRESGAQHTPTFSPDERAITAGVEFMTALALKLTEKNE